MKEIKRYVVSVGYREFIFTDCDTAMDFANMAALTLVADGNGTSFNEVTIRIETEDIEDADEMGM